MNKTKLDERNASVATITATTADNDAIANPRLRPIRRISIVAGTVVDAVATTNRDTGNVAKAALGASDAPIIPPNVTMTIDPVAEIS